MNFILAPGGIFLVIEAIAFSVGEVQLGTLAWGGAFLCFGAWYGWHIWERSNRKEDDDVR